MNLYLLFGTIKNIPFQFYAYGDKALWFTFWELCKVTDDVSWMEIPFSDYLEGNLTAEERKEA